MVKYSQLKPGMVVTFDRSSVDIDKWRRLKQRSIRSPNYTNAEDWYKRTIGRLENVPIIIKGYQRVQHDGDGYTGAPITYTEHLKVETLDGSIKSYLDEEWFDLDNKNAFKATVEEKGRDVRNTRLMAARMGLAHGPESIIASQLSDLPGNAAEQNDSLRQQVDSSYVPPDRKRMSGGKTRRGRKSKKIRRTRKH